MKLRQALPPLDTSLSTPAAARKLLRLLFIALVLGFYAGVYSYVSATLSQEISLRRSYMNAAIANAQSFFVSRQTLLDTLRLAAVRSTTAPVASANVVAGEEVHVGLGSDKQAWSLWLTRRMTDHLRLNKVNLLYVATGDRAEVLRLNPAREPVQLIAPHLLERLNAQDNSSVDELWLTDPERDDSPLYIFTRLDDRSPQSGWLGLEVESPDLLSALHNENAGQFILLDARGELIFDSAQGQSLRQELAQLPAPQSFGLVGGHWLPDHLAIRKQLGFSNWQIVYALDMQALFSALISPC